MPERDLVIANRHRQVCQRCFANGRVVDEYLGPRLGIDAETSHRRIDRHRDYRDGGRIRDPVFLMHLIGDRVGRLRQQISDVMRLAIERLAFPVVSEIAGWRIEILRDIAAAHLIRTEAHGGHDRERIDRGCRRRCRQHASGHEDEDIPDPCAD